MKFRKKPVEVEAVQFASISKLSRVTLPTWFSAAMLSCKIVPCAEACTSDGALIIRTLEGEMRADPGDWIIQGTKGELYPCKPEIFVDIYEGVAEPTPVMDEKSTRERPLSAY